MRKVIAGINMTIDGYCDHTAIEPDAEIHQHYADLLDHAGVILYGRTTYQLMQYWQNLLQNPSPDKSMNDFAVAIDRMPKIVFSNTLTHTGWESAQMANRGIEETVLALKQQPGKHILVGSRSIILQLLELNLIDELQLCIHPVIAGGGLPLFENCSERKTLQLANTKIFIGGAVTLYYQPANK